MVGGRLGGTKICMASSSLISSNGDGQDSASKSVQKTRSTHIRRSAKHFEKLCFIKLMAGVV